jgi:patatin-related protein
VTGLAEAPIYEPLTAGAIAAWRKAANERAAHDAGFAYQGYVRQKLEAVKAYLARLIASICSFRHGSPEARVIEAVVAAWALRRDIVYRDDPATRSAHTARSPAPAWIEFLHAFDVEFRKRRLVFMIQGQNNLYAKLSDGAPAEARRRIDALKRELYQCLDHVRRYESVEFHSSVTCAELSQLFGVPPTAVEMASLDDYAAEFVAKNEGALTSLVERLAADIGLDEATGELDVLLAGVDLTHWSLDAWHEVLVNYVGFPFWDVLTLPLTGWRDLGEFDEIRVDRISPEDAPTLARLADPPELRGTSFLHFGAFFSRAFRENDYLLGRLHAIDRLIDLACNSAGAAATAAVDVAALKRRAFEIVLRSEETHLPNVQSLIERLRAQLL